MKGILLAFEITCKEAIRQVVGQSADLKKMTARSLRSFLGDIDANDYTYPCNRCPNTCFSSSHELSQAEQGDLFHAFLSYEKGITEDGRLRNIGKPFFLPFNLHTLPFCVLCREFMEVTHHAIWSYVGDPRIVIRCPCHCLDDPFEKLEKRLMEIPIEEGGMK